jgi:hypothetical protein
MGMTPQPRPSYLTQQHDRFLRSHYFPGLDLSQLADAFRSCFAHGPRKGWINNPPMLERILANRLSDLGLRKRM